MSETTGWPRYGSAGFVCWEIKAFPNHAARDFASGLHRPLRWLNLVQHDGTGSRATVAITLLVKNAPKPGDGSIHYHDIGDYLNREEKLQILSSASSMQNIPCVLVRS